MMFDKLTEAQEQCLRDQVISLDEPGTILRDFGMLLDFVGSRPIEAAGKYNLLPIKFIGELDERLSRPLRLNLKRPQIRSHPHIQGLNLLLRASALSQIEGVGDKARLVLDPAALVSWNRLNPTEQYFNLLEAWLKFAAPEMIGETGPGWRGMISTVTQPWRFSVNKAGDWEKSKDFHYEQLYEPLYQLALMDLFGIVKVEHAAKPVTPWAPASVKHSRFGDALMILLSSAEFSLPFLIQPENENEDEDEEEDEANDSGFGFWQPLLQPFFPEWRENLEVMGREFREGEFVFHVAMGQSWRRLSLSAERTLEDLLYLILDSFDFDDEHLYMFTYRDDLGISVNIYDPHSGEDSTADEVQLGDLPLQPGETMKLLYDFGDDWRFQIKLERIEPAGPEPSEPRILESHGESPKQYPNWDDPDEESLEFEES